MKKIIITLGLISALSLTALAQQPEGERPQRPDPEAVASKMIADFDKDGNSSLNKVELEAAMGAMRANRGQGGQQNARPRGQQEQPQRPQRPNAQGRDAQTERPERPDMSAMFIKRNDKNEDGELNKAELAGGLAQMNRGGRGPSNREGGRPNAERPKREN